MSIDVPAGEWRVRTTQPLELLDQLEGVENPQAAFERMRALSIVRRFEEAAVVAPFKTSDPPARLIVAPLLIRLPRLAEPVLSATRVEPGAMVTDDV